MRQFIRVVIKLLIAILLIYTAHFIVNRSNFSSLFIPNILFLFGLALSFEAIFSLLCFFSKALEKRKKRIFGTARATFIVLFIADLGIRLTGFINTYSEQTDGNYFSQARIEKLDSWYWVHTPSTFIRYQKKEFTFIRKVNSLGLSEKEIEKKKGSNYRILAIGDSFTEGVGVDYEDTWVKQMEMRWKNRNVQTFNAGIGGSDPVYEFALYRDKLTAYKPDVVVLTINSTDIKDIIGRGGFDRFHADGTAGKDSPSWEWIYASNHLFRMVMNGAFGYNTDLIKNAHSEEMKQKAVTIIKETITKFDELTTKENTEFMVVMHPCLREFHDGILKPFYGQKELTNYFETEGIHYVDLSNEFKRLGKSIPDFYYPLDAHFNKKGYVLFGKTVYEKMEELGLLE
jgi:lysophospholipase L1-like esterase